MQQLVDLSDIRHVGRRADYAVHQARVVIDTDMRLHAEVVLVSLLGLVHLRITLAVLVLGRAGRMNDGRVDDAALTQLQAALAQVGIDDFQDPAGQFVPFQQAAEVEDGRFVRDPIQMQLGKVAQDRHLVEGFLHRGIAVAEPVLHKVHTQHGGQWIGRPSAFAPRVVRLDQCHHRLPRHDLIHLDQEALTPCLFALAGVLGIGEGQLLHPRGSRGLMAYFTRSGSVFQTFPNGVDPSTTRWG
ncbi:hypothetical protein D3C78_1033160 [compost metagenome]